jgi:predicted nucleic acid-binding Zn ribbon protein
MSSGSKKKNRNKKQARKPHQHLPKVGTPADNAYVLHESREELLDFGLTQRRRGPANVVIIALVVALLALGVIGLLIISA